MEKKYKLTEESINFLGRILYRIEALKDFGDVKKGDKGGYVESKNNLSQVGDCWIYNNAKVYDNAQVFGNARVCDKAHVSDNAYVSGRAWVSDYAHVFGNTKVYGDALVYNNTRVYGNAKVYGSVYISDNAKVYGDAIVHGNTHVYGNAQIYGDTEVWGNAKISRNAKVKNNSDYIVFKNWWSSGRYFTWTRSNNMWAVGGFYGTGEELIAKAYEDSELSGKEYERIVNYVESILRDSK